MRHGNRVRVEVEDQGGPWIGPLSRTTARARPAHRQPARQRLGHQRRRPRGLDCLVRNYRPLTESGRLGRGHGRWRVLDGDRKVVRDPPGELGVFHPIGPQPAEQRAWSRGCRRSGGRSRARHRSRPDGGRWSPATARARTAATSCSPPAQSTSPGAGQPGACAARACRSPTRTDRRADRTSRSAGERITRLVHDPVAGALVPDAVGALGIPVRSDHHRQASRRVGQRRDQPLVLVGAQLPAERRRVVGGVAHPGSARVEGDAGQRVPEVSLPVTRGAIRVRARCRPARGGRRDSHAGPSPARCGPGRPPGGAPCSAARRHRPADPAGPGPSLPFGCADLLDGEHVRVQDPDRLGHQPVMLAPGGRVGLEQVQHVVGGKEDGIRRRPRQAHGDSHLRTPCLVTLTPHHRADPLLPARLVPGCRRCRESAHTSRAAAGRGRPGRRAGGHVPLALLAACGTAATPIAPAQPSPARQRLRRAAGPPCAAPRAARCSRLTTCGTPTSRSCR